ASGARRWMTEAEARAPGRFDPGSEQFDPLAFPTDTDMAFLRWYTAHKGAPAALEADLPGLIMAGPCDSGLAMEQLMTRAIALQVCIPPSGAKRSPQKFSVQGKFARNGLEDVMVSPRGEAAGCIQTHLRKLDIKRPRRARCSVAFEVRSTR
ncbi:MAG: hypothetical protein ACI9WU_003087, partial [Myxococcota bacterium]